jgi:citrate synthase
VDPFSAVSAGNCGALWPLHGGANEAVLLMLDEIGHKKNIPAFIESVKKVREADGFGHRSTSVRPARQADQEDGRRGVRADRLNPKLEIAIELERIALEDEYFIKRKLYPNVDSTPAYLPGHGYPTDYFTGCSRWAAAAGWHSGKRCSPTRTRRSRARADLHGADTRAFVPLDKR